MEILKQYPWLEKAYNRTKKNEGFILIPRQVKYTQKDGKEIVEKFTTGGHGHKMATGDNEWEQVYKSGGTAGLTQYWEQKYDEDFGEKAVKALKLLDMNKVNTDAAGIIVEMALQIGVKGVSKFTETLKHINKGHYKEASSEMLKSEWANQTYPRAIRLSDLMYSINDTQ